MRIYNFMAYIIQNLLKKNFKSEEASAIASKSREDMTEQIEGLLMECDFSVASTDSFLDTFGENLMFLALALQRLDELAAEQLEYELWKKKPDFEPFRCIDSLNSQDNRKETGILILPRYACIWEGKSRERNHLNDINTLLKHSHYIKTESGKIDGIYTVKNYILNPSYFALCMNAQNELFLPIAVSPLADWVVMKDIKYCHRKKGVDVNYFMVEELDEEVQKELSVYIEKVMRKSDKNGDKILVFPEMLGTKKTKQMIIEQIRKENFENLHFIVFPSIWEKNGKHKNHNISYILDYEGNEWFGQEKLKRFPWEEGEETFLEDIVEGKELHIVHCEGYGSIAVAICRSELDQDTRNLLMQKLNVKLILCPSWTQGSHEFESSIMTGTERSCNVAWCNTCSALKEYNKQGRTVGIITSFGKNRDYSKLSLDGCKFPEADCQSACKDGCLFSKKIYGTSYNELRRKDGESNGWEGECIDVIWGETINI